MKENRHIKNYQKSNEPSKTIVIEIIQSKKQWKEMKEIRFHL